MQITYLNLKNFCQFSNFTLDLTDEVKNNLGSVIGLIGKNGSGKSNIFKAIGFALTGQFNEPLGVNREQTSYITLGSDADKASIHLKFIVNEIEYEVYKEIHTKIGKAKRYLKYQDESITSSKEIDSKLIEILGCNRDVLNNSVFISQGELNAILKPGVASHVDLFAKLFDIIFLEKNEKAIKEELSKLKKHLEQLNFPQMEDLEIQIVQFKDNLNRVKQKVVESEVYQSIKNYIRELNAILLIFEKINTVVPNKIKALDKDIHLKKIYLDHIKSVHKELLDQQIDIPELDSKIKNIENEIEALNRKLQTRNKVFELKSKLEYLKLTGVENKQKQLSSFVLPYFLIQEQLVVVAKELKEKNNSLEVQKGIKEQSENELQLLKTESNNLHSDFNQAQQERSQLVVLVQIGKNFENRPNCVQCGLKLSQEAIDSIRENSKSYPALLAKAVQKHTELKNKIADVQTKIANTEKLLGRTEWELDKLTIQLDQKHNELQQLETQEKVLSKTVHQEDIVKYESVDEISQEIENLKVTIAEGEKLNQELSYLYEHKGYDLDFSISNEDVEAQIVQKLSITENLKNLRFNLQKNQDAVEKVKSQERELNILLTQRESLVLELTDINIERNQMLTALGFPEDAQEVVIKEEILNKEEELNNALRSEGEYLEAQRALTEAETKFNYWQQKYEENAHLIKLKESLEILATMFHRDGIRSRYLESQFEFLGTHTKKYLNLLEADFTIQPDPNTALSFLISKLDANQEIHWMPMTYLSGGQKVRLCVAFLLALQKVNQVNIGLLFLDEPSNHLDHTGVDTLSGLISTLEPELAATKAQLWICDHNPNLMTSFHKTINLDEYVT